MDAAAVAILAFTWILLIGAGGHSIPSGSSLNYSPHLSRVDMGGLSSLHSQTADSLVWALQTHGSFRYEIQSDLNHPQVVITTLTDARITECTLEWQINTISAAVSRVVSSTDLRSLAGGGVQITELRSMNGKIQIRYKPSLWEIRLAVATRDNSAMVRSTNLETGATALLSSIYLQVDNEAAARVVARLLMQEITRCRLRQPA